MGVSVVVGDVVVVINIVVVSFGNMSEGELVVELVPSGAVAVVVAGSAADNKRIVDNTAKVNRIWNGFIIQVFFFCCAILSRENSIDKQFNNVVSSGP